MEGLRIECPGKRQHCLALDAHRVAFKFLTQSQVIEVEFFPGMQGHGSFLRVALRVADVTEVDRHQQGPHVGLAIRPASIGAPLARHAQPVCLEVVT
ncbi:hypothetical protein D3C85_1555840 [compost metagenome]